jgi:hypothetical protein
MWTHIDPSAGVTVMCDRFLSPSYEDIRLEAKPYASFSESTDRIFDACVSYMKILRAKPVEQNFVHLVSYLES